MGLWFDFLYSIHSPSQTHAMSTRHSAAPPGAGSLTAQPPPSARDHDLRRNQAERRHEEQQLAPSSSLELKRKQNRDYMIRARRRKKDSYAEMKSELRDLDKKLSLVTSRTIEAARSCSDGGPVGHYTQLLAETALLVNANNALREQIRQRKEFRKVLMRTVEQENGLEGEDIAQSDDISSGNSPPAELQGLLRWLRGDQIDKLRETLTQVLLQHVERMDAVVANHKCAVGWTDKRLVETTWLNYLFHKEFPGSDVRTTVEKTWTSTVSLGGFSKVIRWAKDMKILYWLSPDAAIISREIDVPNSDCSDMPTRFSFTLLVSRVATPDGFAIVTQNLNTSGTSIEECFDRDLCSPPGMNTPYTMYGLVFRRAPNKTAGSSEGCSVTLAGVAGNRTSAYVQNLSMEMIPVVLLWEDAIMGSIMRLTSD